MLWKWPTFRRILLVAGLLYIAALIPTSLRPDLSTNVLRKSDQTVTIEQGMNPHIVGKQLHRACRPAWLLRPVMGAARSVDVIVTLHGEPISAHTVNCARYS
jgi:hypothetical protein